VYGRLLDDLASGKTDSPIFRHHIRFVNAVHYTREHPYEDTAAGQIVADYIASMTDDYFLDLHAHLFPDSRYKIEYIGYFG
jgi:dGTPase